jgi:hypothetical protein
LKKQMIKYEKRISSDIPFFISNNFERHFLICFMVECSNYLTKTPFSYDFENFIAICYMVVKNLKRNRISNESRQVSNLRKRQKWNTKLQHLLLFYIPITVNKRCKNMLIVKSYCRDTVYRLINIDTSTVKPVYNEHVCAAKSVR